MRLRIAIAAGGGTVARRQPGGERRVPHRDRRRRTPKFTPMSAPRRCGSRRSDAISTERARQPRTAAARRRPVRRALRAGARRRRRPHRGTARRGRFSLADGQFSAGAGAATSCTKGSIAVDGISLTVARLGDDRFDVQIVPFTIEHTNLKRAQVRDRVNLECDMVGKYVVRAAELAGPVARHSRSARRLASESQARRCEPDADAKAKAEAKAHEDRQRRSQGARSVRPRSRTRSRRSATGG